MIQQFIDQAMKMLLAGDDLVLQVLRTQFKTCTGRSLKKTGVGFFVDFDLQDNVEIIYGNPNFEFGDIQAEIGGVKHGAGFVLFVRDGLLNFLECFTYDDPWPENITEYKLSYLSGEERDLAKLRSNWS